MNDKANELVVGLHSGEEDTMPRSYISFKAKCLNQVDGMEKENIGGDKDHHLDGVEQTKSIHDPFIVRVEYDNCRELC